MSEPVRCLIAGAAPIPGAEDFYRALLDAARTVIAADAAGEWCVDLGRVPDVVVGDLDSSAPGAAGRLRAAGVRVVQIPVEKDVTDLEAALAEARSMQLSDVAFTAAFDGRADHTLAAVGTVLRAADLRARIEEPSWTGWALDGRTRGAVDLSLAPGTTFSVLAPGGAGGVTVTGGDYDLDDADLEPLSGLGVSNVAGPEGRVRVSVDRGTVLVTVGR